MKPTKTLIEAMLKVAEGIEKGTLEYNWNVHEQCNCGLIAMQLLERECGDFAVASEMLNSVVGGSPSWSYAAHMGYCEQTGKPVAELFALLHKHGLEMADFHAIETCGEARPMEYSHPEFVAEFLRFLADELEQRRVSERAQAAETRMTEEPRNSPASGQADATSPAG